MYIIQFISKSYVVFGPYLDVILVPIHKSFLCLCCSFKTWIILLIRQIKAFRHHPGDTFICIHTIGGRRKVFFLNGCTELNSTKVLRITFYSLQVCHSFPFLFFPLQNSLFWLSQTKSDFLAFVVSYISVTTGKVSSTIQTNPQWICAVAGFPE